MTDIETINYYEKYLDLFLTEGWSQFIDQMEEELAQHKETIFHRPKEEFEYYKGQVHVIQRLLSFEQLVRDGYDMILSEEVTNETV